MLLNLRKSDLLFPKGISVVEKYGAKVEETLKGIYVKEVYLHVERHKGDQKLAKS